MLLLAVAEHTTTLQGSVAHDCSACAMAVGWAAS